MFGPILFQWSVVLWYWLFRKRPFLKQLLSSHHYIISGICSRHSFPICRKSHSWYSPLGLIYNGEFITIKIIIHIFRASYYEYLGYHISARSNPLSCWRMGPILGGLALDRLEGEGFVFWLFGPAIAIYIGRPVFPCTSLLLLVGGNWTDPLILVVSSRLIPRILAGIIGLDLK